jgi:hypothetical protein
MSILTGTAQEMLSLPEINKVVLINGAVATAYTGNDIPPELKEPRLIPASDFINRFTEAHKKAINEFCYSGDGNVDGMFILTELNNNQLINLDGELTVNSMNFWVFHGLLTEAEKLEILK